MQRCGPLHRARVAVPREGYNYLYLLNSFLHVCESFRHLFEESEKTLLDFLSGKDKTETWHERYWQWQNISKQSYGLVHPVG